MAYANRISLHLDIDYTAHSSLIGRSGQHVKDIMDSTQTLIHFPDINKFSTIKSNTVLIRGEDVENISRAVEALRSQSVIGLSFIMIQSANVDETLALLEDNAYRQYFSYSYSKIPSHHPSLTECGDDWISDMFHETSSLLTPPQSPKETNLVMVSMKFNTSRFKDIYPMLRDLEKRYTHKANIQFGMTINVDKDFRFNNRIQLLKDLYLNIRKDVTCLQNITFSGSLQSVLMAYANLRENFIIETFCPIQSSGYLNNNFVQNYLEEYFGGKNALSYILYRGQNNMTYVQIRAKEIFKKELFRATSEILDYFELLRKKNRSDALTSVLNKLTI